MSGFAHCPNCDLQWSVPKENAGRPVACPVCARIIPEAEGPPPSQPGQAPAERQRQEGPGRPGTSGPEDRITKPAAPEPAPGPADPGPPQPPAPVPPSVVEVPGPAGRPGVVPVAEKAGVRASRRAPRDRVNWLKLGSSLNWVYQGLCLALLAGPVFCLILFIAQLLLRLTVVVGTALLVLDVIVLALIDLGAIGFTTVGFVGCLSSPSRHAARELAVANLCLFGFTVVAALAAVPLFFLGAGFLLSLLVVALYLGWFFVFLFYLRAVAWNQKARGIAASLLKLTVAVGATLVAEPLFVAAGALLAPAVGPTAGSVLLLVLYGCCGGWLFALCGWFLSDLVSLLADIERNPDEGPHGGRRGWMTLLGANALIFVVWLIFSGVGAPWAASVQQALAPARKSWAARYDWNWGDGPKDPTDDAGPSGPPGSTSKPPTNPDSRPQGSAPSKPAPTPTPTSPGPAGGRITVENLRRIQFGMDEAEVLAILGRPTRTETTTRPGVADRSGEVKTCHWEDASKKITVVFSGGAVAATVGLGLE